MNNPPISQGPASPDQQRQEEKIAQYVGLARRVYHRVCKEPSLRTALEQVEHLESLGFVMSDPQPPKESIRILIEHPVLIFLVANIEEKRELMGLIAKEMTLTDKKLDIVHSDLFVMKPSKTPNYGMLAEELLRVPEATDDSWDPLVQPALDL